MGSSALLALGFVNATLLGGVGLVALPIVIHWLSRRRYRRLPWGAMRFVLEAERENRRRLRLEHWLLLALRCLALALIALMLARPFVRPGLVGALFGQQESVRRVIVLDDSASLQYAETATDFERLQSSAEQLLNWIADEAGDMPLIMCTTSDPAEPCFSSDRFGPESLNEARSALRALKPGVARADPARLCTQLAAWATGEDATRTDVFLMSDLQASDWMRGANHESAFAELRGAAARRLRLVLVEPEDRPRDNVAVVDLSIDQRHVVAGSPVSARVRVENRGRQVVENLTLQFDLDSKPLPAKVLKPLQPGESRTVTSDLTCPVPGFVTLTARLGRPDRFTLDNERRVALHVREALNILVVNGSPATDPRHDEVYLLRHALAPPGPLGSGVRTTERSPEQLSGADLDAYDVVMLCNIGSVAGGVRDALRRFVDGGGGLTLSLGDNTRDAEGFNRSFCVAGKELAPLPLGDAVDASARPAGFVRAADTAFARKLTQDDGRLSEYVRFRRYMRTGSASPELTPAPLVLARFDDDEQTPALIERRVGRGRVLLFTSSIGVAWNNWAAAVDGSYVVTLLELTQYLARGESHPSGFVGGELLAVPVDLSDYGPQVVFKSPAYPQVAPVSGRQEATESTGGEQVTMLGPVADELGTFTVELTPRSGTSEARPLCVNLDPLESDLRRATREELAAALGEIPHVFATLEVPAGGVEADSRRELWPALLGLLVAVLMVEQVCAWWWGRVTLARRTGPWREGRIRTRARAHGAHGLREEC